ncbi:MAG TPA: HAD family hydrolase [Actinobacteria bacterium]|jgi:HAD superfamily hydrolase (TIGR01484 family)|nr:HAD family hydrolase [Actinomycetota bacterium]
MTTMTALPDLTALGDFRPQLIALDLDDTLLPHSGIVPQEAVDAIARVREMGIEVVAATGRSFGTTAPVCAAAGIETWAVCSNGSMLASLDPEEIVETIAFDPADLLIAVRERVPDAMLAVEDPTGVFRTTMMFAHSALTEGIRETSFEELLAHPVIRVVVRSDAHLDEGLGHLAQDLGLHSVVFGVAEVAWMDIGPQGVSKATMLQRLCDRLGIDRAQTLAIGDSMNDAAMLEWAGRGVLMGHAHASMHQHADLLTGLKPGYGVAEALNAIGA